MYHYLNRAKYEDGIEALDVGVGKEGCWDGEHLQRGEEVARHRRSPRNVHVHLIAQVTDKIQDIGNVGSVAEQHQSCARGKMKKSEIDIIWSTYSIVRYGPLDRYVTVGLSSQILHNTR